MSKSYTTRCAMFAIAMLLTGAVANATIVAGSPDDGIPSLVYNSLDGSLSIDTGGFSEVYYVSVYSDYGIFNPYKASPFVTYTVSEYEITTVSVTPLYDGTVIGDPGFMEDGENESWLHGDLTFIFQLDPWGDAYYGDLVYYTGIVDIDGDQNEDGFVGIEDLNIILGSWNQTVSAGTHPADPSGDGFVGIEDLNIVLGNWNAGTAPSANVPEPGTAFLLATAIGAGVIRRNRS